MPQNKGNLLGSMEIGKLMKGSVYIKKKQRIFGLGEIHCIRCEVAFGFTL